MLQSISMHFRPFCSLCAQDYLKVASKVTKDHASLVKKHEKALKSVKEKVGKGKTTEESLRETEKQQEADMATFDKNASTKVQYNYACHCCRSP